MVSPLRILASLLHNSDIYYKIHEAHLNAPNENKNLRVCQLSKYYKAVGYHINGQII